MEEYYKLVDKVPVQVDDIIEWGKYMESANRTIERTLLTESANENNKIGVSTVFLGIDHNYVNQGDPVLFETLVFGGQLDGEIERYCTYDEAEKGHSLIVEKVLQIEKANLNPHLIAN